MASLIQCSYKIQASLTGFYGTCFNQSLAVKHVLSCFYEYIVLEIIRSKLNVVLSLLQMFLPPGQMPPGQMPPGAVIPPPQGAVPPAGPLPQGPAAPPTTGLPPQSFSPPPQPSQGYNAPAR